MSDIYLKFTIEKNWGTQNFDVVSLKTFSPDQFSEGSNSSKYRQIFKLFAVT